MTARTTLPTDDLYARLGVPSDASPEAIEVAWRGLLRRHHPDIAGPAALDLAKRINVAHDWLSEPGLRRRYDQERGTSPRAAPASPDRAGPAAAASSHGRPPRRARTMAERVAAIVERTRRLTAVDLERLALAEPAPIAFLATLRRFMSPDLRTTLDEAERDALAGLRPAARRDPAIRDAVTGKLAETILGDALEELLGEPAGSRARERLSRGWDAAIDQPRYGPATATVEAFLASLATMTPGEVRALAATGATERLGDAPWPGGTSPEEDEALRVSSALAGRAAAEAVRGDDPVPQGARRAAARIAHLLVLRHAISAAAFERLAAPWLGGLVSRAAPTTARIRRR